MKLKIVEFETARLLKELGFDIEVRNRYDNFSGTLEDESIYDNYNANKYKFISSAPTQELVKKWLREVHGIHIMIDPIYHKLFGFTKYVVSMFKQDWGDIKIISYMDTLTEDVGLDNKEYKTFEEASEAVIIKALKLIK